MAATSQAAITIKTVTKVSDNNVMDWIVMVRHLPMIGEAIKTNTTTWERNVIIDRPFTMH